jgi:hypothetical protein
MSLRDRWQRIVAFGQEREEGTSLALTRIAVCTTLAAHFIRLVYTGGAELAWTAPEYGGFASRPGYLEHVGGNTPGAVLALCGVVIVASLMGALGLFTRASLLVAFLAFRACTEMNGEARSGYDSLIVNMLFLLIISGCGRALSLDARIFKKPTLVSRWPRMLFVFQIALIYGGTALMKGSAGWVPGGDADALWFILHQPMWSRFAELPSWSFFLSQVATTTTWLWELSGPLFAVSVWLRESPPTKSKFWMRVARVLDRVRFRELWLLGGLGIHLGIELFMEVGVFSPASVSLYFCAIRPDEWRAFAAKVRARFARR